VQKKTFQSRMTGRDGYSDIWFHIPTVCRWLWKRTRRRTSWKLKPYFHTETTVRSL